MGSSPDRVNSETIKLVNVNANIGIGTHTILVLIIKYRPIALSQLQDNTARGCAVLVGCSTQFPNERVCSSQLVQKFY
jgi:hypothetical protein